MTLYWRYVYGAISYEKRHGRHPIDTTHYAEISREESVCTASSWTCFIHNPCINSQHETISTERLASLMRLMLDSSGPGC